MRILGDPCPVEGRENRYEEEKGKVEHLRYCLPNVVCSFRHLFHFALSVRTNATASSRRSADLSQGTRPPNLPRHCTPSTPQCTTQCSRRGSGTMAKAFRLFSRAVAANRDFSRSLGFPYLPCASACAQQGWPPGDGLAYEFLKRPSKFMGEDISAAFLGALFAVVYRQMQLSPATSGSSSAMDLMRTWHTPQQASMADPDQTQRHRLFQDVRRRAEELLQSCESQIIQLRM